MTQHTLKYIYKRRGFCKAITPEPGKTPEPEPPKPTITNDIVNDTKQNPEIISTYFRDERSMKAQRKQMHVRTLLNNAFLTISNYSIIYKKCSIRRRKQPLALFSLIN